MQGRRRFGKFFGLLIVAALLFGAMPVMEAQAATLDVCPSGCTYATIQEAIDAASEGDTITVGPGTYYPAATIMVNKPVSIIGPVAELAKVVGAGDSTVRVFEISASNVAIKNLTITLGAPPTNYDGLIEIPNQEISNIEISDNVIFVDLQSGPMSTWWARGIEAGRNISNLIISGNEIYNTRTGVVLSYNSSAQIVDNVIYNTKGGIMNYTNSEADADSRVILNNSWNGIHSEWDIVWNSGGGPYPMDMNKFVLGVSQANNEAYVVSQMPTEYTTPPQLIFGSRSHIFVDAINGTTTVGNNNGNTNVPYARIQDAINAVVPGGKIYVAAGTYVEDLNMPHPVNLIGIGMPVIQGKLNINHSGYSGSETMQIEGIRFETLSTVKHDSIELKGVDGITFKGCQFDGGSKFMAEGAVAVQMRSPVSSNVTIEDSTFENGYYVTIQGSANGLTVRNSTIANVKSGINLMSGSRNLVVEDSAISVVAQGAGNDTYGIRFGSASGITENMSIIGGNISVDKNGLAADAGIYHSAIVIRSASGVLSIDGMAIDGEIVNLSSTSLDASPNWWGSAAGPYLGQILGDVSYMPWCGDAACSFTVPDEYGKINVPGGIVLDQPGTYVIPDGVTIQNDSPCFIINASNTKIMGESLLGAKCIPTGGSNAIDVADGLNNIVIEGFEIDGMAGVGNHGVNYAGVVTDTIVRDMYIHGLAGDGIYFTAQPAGTVQIQGNLFMANGGVGVNNPAGTQDVDATFNAWGAYGGPENGGDGVGDHVAFNNWTHASVTMESSGTVYAHQVVKDQEITYTVKTDLKQAMGADFVLDYPDQLSVVDLTAGELFDVELLEDSGGKLHFLGYQFGLDLGDGPRPPVEGEGLTLFTVVFKGETLGKELTLDLAAKDFSIAPPYGPSTNLYPAEMEDVTGFEIVALPTLTITPTGSYIAGLPIEFTIAVDNTDGAAYAGVDLDFTLPAGAILKYWDGTAWEDASDPFILGALAADGTPSQLFQVTFVAPGDNVISIDLMDRLPDPDYTLATASQTFTTLGDFTVEGTLSMQGRSERSGLPVTLTGITAPFYGPFTVNTTSSINANVLFTGINGGSFQITTSQPRYLNVTVALNKIINVSGHYVFAMPLELRGGNADWTDNIINLSDAGIVGGAYGVGTITSNGDVNFDGRVSVQDLAMVGGNFDLTSADAYALWQP